MCSGGYCLLQDHIKTLAVRLSLDFWLYLIRVIGTVAIDFCCFIAIDMEKVHIRLHNIQCGGMNERKYLNHLGNSAIISGNENN